MEKQSKRGGARRGAGRKATGRNVVNSTISLPIESWEKLAELAEAQGISKNKLTARVVQEWLDRQ